MVIAPSREACAGVKPWPSMYQTASYSLWTCGSPGAAVSAACSRAEIQPPASSCVTGQGEGCVCAENWFVSLPSVSPRKFGASRRPRASRSTSATWPSSARGSVNMFLSCHVYSHDGTKSKLDRCPWTTSILASMPNSPAMSTTARTSSIAFSRMRVRFGCSTVHSGKTRTWSRPSSARAEKSRRTSSGVKSSQECIQFFDGV